MKDFFRKKYLLLAVIFVSNMVLAQTTAISGIVTDEGGLPLPGVNIVAEGTTNGTQTDFDGKYSIEASVGETLLFSYIGMESVKIIVANSNTINVSMKESASQLDIGLRQIRFLNMFLAKVSYMACC